MSFTNPSALLLLLLLPVVLFIGWPRLVYRRRRDTISLIIRLVLVTLIIFGLAGIQIQRVADKLAVVFLIDVSDSVPPAFQSAAIDYVRSASEAMGLKDQAAVVVFGANALVEIPISDRLELVQMGSDPVRLNTDLAEAMRLGLALFPADTAKRMVILSDGKQTVGDAEEVARLADATDVQVDYVVLSSDNLEEQVAGPEIMVDDVRVPAKVNEGEKFDLTVVIASNRNNSLADVQILARGMVIHRQGVQLQQGENTYVIPDITVPTAGFVDFRVIVEPRSADTFYQNNELSAFTEVTGPPRILLVASEQQEIASLQAAFEQGGLQVDVRGPGDIPLGLAPLSSYDSIVLANVSASDLSQDRMAYLQSYVRDLGGGLVVIGGPNSYGVGGYFDTPLEEMLPVDMRLRDQQRIPQLTMLFVIDRSGSMEIASASGVSNLELAKEAVARSFDLLNDDDRTGVLSFDVAAYFVVEPQYIGDEANRQALRDTVGSLRPGGGTNIRQAVLAADQVLRDDPSQLKHIILLTDGGSDPSGIVPAVDRMYQNYEITTSVVAVGRDYAQWLQEVASAGHGQFHIAYDVSTIPAIFTAETLLATRSYIFEQDFTPALVTPHPIMHGFDSLPILKGYVATSAKDLATVILSGPENDPILASWQYGLGRSIAFTSDASSRWGVNWVNWSGYADFWSQAVRWTITEGNTDNVEAYVTQRGEQAILTVDVRNTQGNFLNGLNLDAAIVNSQLDTNTLTLRQTAPGRYEAVFMPEQEGAYFITVAGATSDQTVPQQSLIQTTGWVLSYSSEYRVDLTGAAQEAPSLFLKRLADITGGRSLRERPKNAFLHDLNQEQAAQPIWSYLLLMAAVLFPFDVAARRLVITRRDVERVRGVLGMQKVALPAQPSARMGRLMDAKGRAHSTGSQSTDTANRQPDTPRPVVPVVRAAPKVAQSPKVAPKVVSKENSLASRLLERRKSSQDRDES